MTCCFHTHLVLCVGPFFGVLPFVVESAGLPIRCEAPGGPLFQTCCLEIGTFTPFVNCAGLAPILGLALKCGGLGPRGKALSGPSRASPSTSTAEGVQVSSSPSRLLRLLRMLSGSFSPFQEEGAPSRTGSSLGGESGGVTEEDVSEDDEDAVPGCRQAASIVVLSSAAQVLRPMSASLLSPRAAISSRSQLASEKAASCGFCRFCGSRLVGG